MYLANKLVDEHIKTFITYNKGQTWALLPAPPTDVAGNNLNCILVSGADGAVGFLSNKPSNIHLPLLVLGGRRIVASARRFIPLNG